MTKAQSPGQADPSPASEPENGRRWEDLPPAAQRALREAEERRKNATERAKAPTEVGGRGGSDPSRFGDWEIDGRAIDF